MSIDINKLQETVEQVDSVITEQTDNNVSTDNLVSDTNNNQVSNTNNVGDIYNYYFDKAKKGTLTSEDREYISNNNDLSYEQKRVILGVPNLVPFNKLTKEKQREIASAGGKKSGEVRHKRKTAAQLLADILARELSSDQIDEILGNAANLLGEDKSAYNVMNVKALQCAMSGDTKAMQFVRDTVGDKPVEQQQITTDVMTDADRALIAKVQKRIGETS